MQLQGNRKILFGFGIVAIGIVLDRLIPGGLSTNLLELLKFVCTGFFLGNAAEHVAGAYRTSQDDSDDSSPPPAVVATDPQVAAQLTSLQAEVATLAPMLKTIMDAIKFVIEKAGFNRK